MLNNEIAFDGVLNAGYRLGYTYSAESPFRLDTVTDASYRTVSEPGSGDYSDRRTYTYDRNGNLTGEFTDRATLDLGKSRRASERLLAWDEENRLTAVCDNGYVSTYLYDADGERVFKASCDATHMYVDAAEASGGVTDTRSFTLYVSPYLVVGEDGRYTKHFYAGAQRVVSKVGDRASYGSDPRTIDRAGNDYDSRLHVDYAAKKAALEGAIAAQYERFGVPFRGMDHDNRTDEPQRSFADPADYERQQYFYHPDHLGSTSYVTDADGNVAQHVEYVPFGEVLVDQRATDWSAPYLFNAKELDEETGLYYYGARYYNPRLSLWLSVDPMAEFIPNKTAYKFSNNNPIRFIDPTGMYETEDEAYKASRQFNNAPVLQDKKSGEWFISINEYGNDAYKSGPTVTRFFGVKRPSWNSALFGASSGVSYWQHTQYNTTLEIWRGKNYKIYQGLTGRGPNQYTGSRSIACAKTEKLGYASDALTIVGIVSTELAYRKTLNYNLGPNMRRYVSNKRIRDQVFNASGFFGVYGATASFGYNLGYLIEDIGQWITNNPDFRIRYNPYTKDFTPIEKTLQEYDEMGIIIY